MSFFTIGNAIVGGGGQNNEIMCLVINVLSPTKIKILYNLSNCLISFTWKNVLLATGVSNLGYWKSFKKDGWPGFPGIKS